MISIREACARRSNGGLTLDFYAIAHEARPASPVTPAKAGAHIPEACVYGPRLSPGRHVEDLVDGPGLRAVETHNLKNSLKLGGSLSSIVQPSQGFDMGQPLLRRPRVPVGSAIRIVPKRRDGERVAIDALLRTHARRGCHVQQYTWHSSAAELDLSGRIYDTG